MPSKRIAFVGVGRMGANMARRLVDCGHNLTAVYDTNRPAAEALAHELDVSAPESLAGVTLAADIVFTVVSDDAAMRRIFTAKKDNLLMKANRRVFINCATVSPDIHRKVEGWAREAGAASLEACMASSIPQARDGTLYLMLAGDKRAFKRVEALLGDLSQKLRYIGEAGRAGEVKALVNMVMNCNTAALAEGLGLGHALGLDLDVLREVFAQTGANSRVLETDAEDMQNRDHECYFSAAHAAKDAGIALAMARRKKLSLPLAEATLRQYQRMEEAGLGQLDKSGVAELTFKDRSPARA